LRDEAADLAVLAATSSSPGAPSPSPASTVPSRLDDEAKAAAELAC
jgi:hypothetical protein